MTGKLPYEKTDITGYILAGGKSSRMGTDKGLMLFHDKPLVQHVIDRLKPAVGKLAIISNNPAYKDFGFGLVPDITTGIGPAGGIQAALTHSDTSLNFILSCDMPFVTTAAVEFMLGQASGAAIVLPRYHGKLQPLFGVYAGSCLGRWNELIQQGFLKLHDMVACFELLMLDIGGNPLFKEPFFANINTKEDLAKALTNTNL